MSWRSLSLVAYFGFIALSLLTAPSAPFVLESRGCAGGSGANGVLVDAAGVLRNEVFQDDPQLVRQRMMAARVKLGKQLGAASKFRKVSLNRLESALKDRLDKKLGPTEEMLYLAGLTRLNYVFYYPETKDIVLAGPAEAWAVDPAGRARGIESGWTTLELQDLIVALRASRPASRERR